MMNALKHINVNVNPFRDRINVLIRASEPIITLQSLFRNVTVLILMSNLYQREMAHIAFCFAFSSEKHRSENLCPVFYDSISLYYYLV